MNEIYFYAVLCLYVAAFVFWVITQREWVAATIGAVASALASVYYFANLKPWFGAGYVVVAGLALHTAYKLRKKERTKSRG